VNRRRTRTSPLSEEGARDDRGPGGLPLSLPGVEDIDAVPMEHLPAVIALFAALQARAAARLATLPPGEGDSPSAADGRHRLLTIPQVAELLGVPVSYAYELARRRLPSIRMGKYVRVRVDDLEAWIGQHRDR